MCKVVDFNTYKSKKGDKASLYTKEDVEMQETLESIKSSIARINELMKGLKDE